MILPFPLPLLALTPVFSAVDLAVLALIALGAFVLGFWMGRREGRLSKPASDVATPDQQAPKVSLQTGSPVFPADLLDSFGAGTSTVTQQMSASLQVQHLATPAQPPSDEKPQ